MSDVLTTNGLWVGLLVIQACMFALWLWSVRIRDASIVDGFWGVGFVILACTYAALLPGYAPRSALIVCMVSVWGLRLAAHIVLRNHGQGEDYRYQEMRKRWGHRFALVSLGTVFMLQGALLWLIAMPLYQAARATSPAKLGVLDALGVLLFIVGLFFEAVGDWQLRRFRSDPSQRGQVLRTGLWRYTRHPNYFGDALVWWGLGLVALATDNSLWAMFGPALMTFLLMRVSGVALLERKLARTRPKYADYVATTNAFFPWRPHRHTAPPHGAHP